MTAPNVIFQDALDNEEHLNKYWHLDPGMQVVNGVLDFTPKKNSGFCMGVTKNEEFSDFTMICDLKIVLYTASIVVRHQNSERYYMIQYSLRDPGKIKFNTFTPEADCGWKTRLIDTEFFPKEGEWFTIKVTIRGYDFSVFFGSSPTSLKPAGNWTDHDKAYDQGAIGLWQYGGEDGMIEQGCYQNLTVLSV